MKRLFGMAIFALCLVVLGSAAQIQIQVVPEAVSPGSEGAVAVVRQDCPTFSWTAVDWALGYRVAVFQAFETEVPGYEEMAAVGAPLLSKEIPGRALSWTPSAEERLSSGSLYVWYVQALDSSGQGTWSKGKLFLVEAGGWPSGVAERVRKTLKEKGVSEEEINELFQEGKPEQAGGAISGAAPGSVEKTQGGVGIQGYESANNTFYGLDAGALSSGNYSSFFGFSAGFQTTGNFNTILGFQAGRYNTSGEANTFQGYHAGFSNTTGSYNTFQGFSAGNSNTTGNYNTFLGPYAGYYNSTGYYNSFLGYAAGANNITGNENTFVGLQAGFKNTGGIRNAILGATAGYANTTGQDNTFIGTNAGYANTAGSYNTFLGMNAGYSNTTAQYGLFMGWEAGTHNTTGDYNTFMGYRAGSSNTTGRVNVFLGPYTGFANTTGTNNTFLGAEAGENNISGSLNVFVGFLAGYNETGSNKLYIDNSTTSSPLIYGDFSLDDLRFNGQVGINITPTHLLDVGGSGAYCNGGAWVDGSSREYKENIQTLTTEKALKAFQELEPVEYNYKADSEEKYLGFIAEDVPELVAMKDRKGMSPMDVVAVLTKVVQEQQKTISDYQKTMSEQQKTISELAKRVGKLEKKGKAGK